MRSKQETKRKRNEFEKQNTVEPEKMTKEKETVAENQPYLTYPNLTYSNLNLT